MSSAGYAPSRRGRPRTKKKSITELIDMTTPPLQNDTTLAADPLIPSRNARDDDYQTETTVNRELLQGMDCHGLQLEEEPETTSDYEAVDDGDEDSEHRPKPVGRSIGSADEGGELYAAFEWDGKKYELDDAVMVTPEDDEVRPGVAIIKEIREAQDGIMLAILRWLYRPEEVDIKDDPRWLLYDTRELLFTDHTEEVLAATILYKCVVHFLPSHEQLPNRRVHPGFVVQHFYDHLKQRVFSITDEGCCKVSLRKEICVRMRETELRIGYLPNIDNRDETDHLKEYKNYESLLGGNTQTPNNGKDNRAHDKHGLERRDEGTSMLQQKANTPRPLVKKSYVNILKLFGILTTDNRRDEFLVKLLEAIHSQWYFIKSKHDDALSLDPKIKAGKESEEGKKGIRLIWPDSVIPRIFDLEYQADITYSKDTQKYLQKMRKLVFNLKNNGLLAKRFVTRELTPSILLKMTPDELLKADVTADEPPRDDSDGKQEMQMVNVLCKRCSEKKVRLLDVIQAGIKQRYQLECTECGNTWFGSSNEIS